MKITEFYLYKNINTVSEWNSSIITSLNYIFYIIYKILLLDFYEYLFSLVLKIFRQFYEVKKFEFIKFKISKL